MPNCVRKTAPPPVGITATRELPKIPANPIPTTTSRPCSPGARKPDIGSRKPDSPSYTFNQNPQSGPRASSHVPRPSVPEAPSLIRFSPNTSAARSATKKRTPPRARPSIPAPGGRLAKESPGRKAGETIASRSETMEQLPGLATATPNIAPRAALMADVPGGVTAASFALGPLQFSFACFPLRLPVLANRSPLNHHESAPPSIPRSRVRSLTTKH
jgi:hypothetical protein